MGEDAALISKRKEKTLVSTDSLVEGIDFNYGKLSPENVGRKALAMNLSDIAAMGGRPQTFLISLGIPKPLSENWILRFYDGVVKIAKKFKVKCAGGDISQARQFFASLTILGSAPPQGRVVRRSGAQAGNLIGVTGRLGGSILRHHYDFEPRIYEGQLLARKGVTAMIDISDGLLQDLEHLLKASGKGAEIDLKQIPVSKDASQMAHHDKEKAVDRALSDGEDFELLFTISPSKKRELEQAWSRNFPRVSLSWIGRVTKEKSRIKWFYHSRPVSAPPLKRKGYSHFA